MTDPFYDKMIRASHVYKGKKGQSKFKTIGRRNDRKRYRPEDKMGTRKNSQIMKDDSLKWVE